MDPGGLVAGVVVAPKGKLGVPEEAAAPPNRPPAAGAVLVVLLGAAPEELGVPKLNMVMGRVIVCLFESLAIAIGERQLLVK